MPDKLDIYLSERVAKHLGIPVDLVTSHVVHCALQVNKTTGALGGYPWQEHITRSQLTKMQRANNEFLAGYR